MIHPNSTDFQNYRHIHTGTNSCWLNWYRCDLCLRKSNSLSGVFSLYQNKCTSCFSIENILLTFVLLIYLLQKYISLLIQWYLSYIVNISNILYNISGQSLKKFDFSKMSCIYFGTGEILLLISLSRKQNDDVTRKLWSKKRKSLCVEETVSAHH
jgi:hypothetical protein